MQRARFPFPITYLVEFGDFPGGGSQEYYQPYDSPWLHTSEFFKWVVDSDAMVFVIDLAQYLIARTDYVAKTSSAFRAAWQRFIDDNRYRTRQIRQHPLVVVFTKADLLAVREDLEPGTFQKQIAELGFGEFVPPIRELQSDALENMTNRASTDFTELLEYLRTETSNFHVVFTSSFGLADGKRFGLATMLDAVLPH